LQVGEKYLHQVKIDFPW